MKLPWFDQTENPIDPRGIDGAELLLGVRFPKAYRDVLANHHDASGDAEFSVPGTKHGAVIGHWLSLGPWDAESVWSFLSAWPEHQLPRSIVPFGQDGGGNCICFDYRSNSEPSVVFWYHELAGTDGLVTIASTFEEFAGLLRTPAEA
jgi:hypothetical protein